MTTGQIIGAAILLLLFTVLNVHMVSDIGWAGFCIVWGVISAICLSTWLVVRDL